MLRNHLVRSVSDIRRGVFPDTRVTIRAGWAMGPFYPPDELPFTADFEVKEWDAALVRKSWDDHVSSGPEYISVTRGTLTIVGGDAVGGTEHPVERERLDVAAGSSIVLRPGYWRRFECTPDAAGLSIRLPARIFTEGSAMSEGRATNLEERYKAFTEHWKHTDQIRQLLLYNFLMASTILVAGWGVLYAMPVKPSVLLKALSILGVVLALLWLIIARRSTGYYNMYEAEARQIERDFVDPQRWPFHARAGFRANLPGALEGRIRAVAITAGVPLLFLVFFGLTLAF